MTAPYQRDGAAEIIRQLANRVSALEAKGQPITYSGQKCGGGSVPGSGGAFLSLDAFSTTVMGFTNDTTLYQRSFTPGGQSGIEVDIGGIYLFYVGAKPNSGGVLNITIEGTCEARDAATNTWTFIQPLQTGQWLCPSDDTSLYANHGFGVWVLNLATGQDKFRFRTYGVDRTGGSVFFDGGGTLLVRLAALPLSYSNLGAETGSNA